MDTVGKEKIFKIAQFCIMQKSVCAFCLILNYSAKKLQSGVQYAKMCTMYIRQRHNLGNHVYCSDYYHLCMQISVVPSPPWGSSYPAPPYGVKGVGGPVLPFAVVLPEGGVLSWEASKGMV